MEMMLDMPASAALTLKVPGKKLTRDEMKNIFLDNPCPDGSDSIGPCINGCPDGFYCVAGNGGFLHCCEIV